MKSADTGPPVGFVDEQVVRILCSMDRAISALAEATTDLVTDVATILDRLDVRDPLQQKENDNDRQHYE